MEANPDVNGLMPNMAAMPRDMLVEALHRGIFKKGDHGEAFIIKAARFFDSKNKTMKGLLVLGLISKELRDKYESTQKSDDKGFENWMKQAFPKSHGIYTNDDRGLKLQKAWRRCGFVRAKNRSHG